MQSTNQNELYVLTNKYSNIISWNAVSKNISLVTYIHRYSAMNMLHL